MYNKQLQITDEDINAESNLETLYLWKSNLTVQITELLMDVDDKRNLPYKKKKLYKCLFTLRKVISLRIAELKLATGYRSERSRKRDRELSMLFMQKAKMLLDKETYSTILSAAKAEKAKAE